MRLMKNIIFLLTLITLYGCSNDDYLNPVSEDVTTRSSTNPYTFDFYTSIRSLNFDYQKVDLCPSNIYIHSYTTVDGTDIDLWPEVISKPDWVDKVSFINVYYKLYLMLISVNENTMASERDGRIYLHQPESGKTLSIPVTQGERDNKVIFKVNRINQNRFEFMISSKYPVKEDISVFLPYTIYNSGAEMNETVYVHLTTGNFTNSTIIDYASAPIVYYHGNISGYRLGQKTLYVPSPSFYNYILIE